MGARIIDVKRSVFDDNDKDADLLRAELSSRGVLMINLMSSPGSGKTSTLVKTISALDGKLSVAVMEADIDSDVDANKILELTHAQSVQLHTGGMCHIDADMSRQGLSTLDLDKTDLVILENVGNLVCPAEFDAGAHKNVVILSVPEGHDKPLKYPLVFSICDLVLINKIDALPYFDFDMAKCLEYIKERNPAALVLPISAKTGEGIDKFAEWLAEQAVSFKK